MMKEQSIPFIVGYLFSKMDTSIFKHFNVHKRNLIDSQLVPKIWFGLSSCSSVTNDIKGELKYQMKTLLEKTLKDLYPKFETTVIRIVPEKQFIRFDFNVKPIPEAKKMTIAEIEKALGYKIEIVSDK